MPGPFFSSFSRRDQKLLSPRHFSLFFHINDAPWSLYDNLFLLRVEALLHCKYFTTWASEITREVDLTSPSPTADRGPFPGMVAVQWGAAAAARLIKKEFQPCPGLRCQITLELHLAVEFSSNGIHNVCAGRKCPAPGWHQQPYSATTWSLVLFFSSSAMPIYNRETNHVKTLILGHRLIFPA